MAAVAEVRSQVGILRLDVAAADRERQAATAQVTERRSLLRYEQRIALGEYENPGSELDVVGPSREKAECGERLQHVPEGFGETGGEQHMIVCPERRIAKRIGRVRNGDD